MPTCAASSEESFKTISFADFEIFCVTEQEVRKIMNAELRIMNRLTQIENVDFI
jgi:hypothetical protein